MDQRCNNPKDKGHHNYGSRGIKFNFDTILNGALWVMDNLGLHRHLELDRIDNNGHYEPGNLRYATRTTQQKNRRDSKVTIQTEEWAKIKSPYGVFTTLRMLRLDWSEQQIIASAKKAVQEKRKNWRTIEENLARLGHTTS
jgi:hypothetical protein